MKKKLSKTEAQRQVDEFFESIGNKTEKDVKKIKRLAMAYNIKLGEKRKLFCKKCHVPHKDVSIRIKDGSIKITCGHCENINKWKIE